MAVWLACVGLGACGETAVVFDAGQDAAGFDAADLDAGHADAGPIEDDAGPDPEDADVRTDAGREDAGTDAGVEDAGAPDAGTDAGTPDAGTDAGPPDAGPPDAGTDAGPPPVVSGRVRYEDRPWDADGFTGDVVVRPSAGVRVVLLDSRDEILEEAITDDEGRFTFAGTGDFVEALSDGFVGDHHVQVGNRDARPRFYRLRAAAGPDLELLAETDAEGGAFNIIAVAREAMAFYEPYVGDAAPTLTYFWARGRSFGCGSCYSSNRISLGGGFDDPDEYDDVIILHELAHYFVDHYSRDDSPGGPHRDRQVSPVLAYGEGLGYFFAQWIDGRPLVVDTFRGSVRSIDVEVMTIGGVAIPEFRGTTDGTVNGDLREEIVNGILWDAYDEASADEPFDRVALGDDGMMALLVDHFGAPTAPPNQGAPGIDLSDLLHALVCFSGVPAADVQALADDRAFPWTAPATCD